MQVTKKDDMANDIRIHDSVKFTMIVHAMDDANIKWSNQRSDQRYEHECHHMIVEHI